MCVYAYTSVCVCAYVGAYVHVCVCMCVCVHVCVCVCVCKQLPSNQSFDKQIYSYQKGGGVSRWGEWVRKATAYKFDACTLIGVHSTMYLVDPIKVHVSYTCVCMCVNVIDYFATLIHSYSIHTHNYSHRCTYTLSHLNIARVSKKS